jgi:GTPase
MMADIGLVGYPNAGKSTLISSITRSKPKIASYEFTTINPNLGEIKFVDNKNVTLVDIPGLVEDSSKNKGLGH